MRLLVVTQQVDPSSPVLGATVAKLRALAARVDELVVLADSAMEGVLPGNCHVRLFRASRRAGRGLRFETALARELGGRPRPAAVLAHMCPIYAVLAAIEAPTLSLFDSRESAYVVRSKGERRQEDQLVPELREDGEVRHEPLRERLRSGAPLFVS